MPIVVCPLCGNRRARRGCPAVGQQICTVCCGTKRLVEINCPPDCVWLASAREHPPAAVVRREQRDRTLMMPLMLDFTERQVELFFLIANVVLRYEPPEFHAVADEDVEESLATLASTFETAAKGVIYDHRAASLTAERLVTALKPALAEIGRGRGSAFEREAASVLRRMATLAGEVRAAEPGNQRAFLELLRRLVTAFPLSDEARRQEGAAAAGDRPPLIVP